MKIGAISALVALFLTFIAPLASAADEFAMPSAAKRPFTLGAGVVYRDKVYEDYSDSDKVQPIPLILYEGDVFFVRGSNLGWKLVSTNPWEVAVLGEFWGDGYDSDDADILEGMDDRDPSFALGAHVIWRPEKFGLKLSAAADVVSASDGNQVRGEAFFANRVDSWFYRASAGAVWNDGDFIDYYYGVQSDEVDTSLGRTFYEGDSEYFYRAGLVVGYQRPQSPWLFVFGGRYDFMGDEVDDSPITSEDEMFTGFLGFGYTFGR